MSSHNNNKVQQDERPSNNEVTDLDSINKENDKYQDSSILKQYIPPLNKILIHDDDHAQDELNKVLKYAISLSNYSGAELLILQIIEDIEKMEDVYVEGSNDPNNSSNATSQNMKREVQGQVIDSMEKKVKKCKEAGGKNKISYKFRTGNAIDEIVNEVEDGNYDLVVKSSNIDSWMKSLFR